MWLGSRLRDYLNIPGKITGCMRELARELRGRVVLSTATLGGLERISTISLPKIEISEIPMAVANITPKDMMFMLSKGNASRKS